MGASLSPDDLTAEEQEMWLSEFADQMSRPSEPELAYFAERRRRGLGVGLSEDGELVYQAPRKVSASDE